MVRLGDVGEFVAVRNQWRSVDQLELAVGYVGVGEHIMIVLLFEFLNNIQVCRQPFNTIE